VENFVKFTGHAFDGTGNMLARHGNPVFLVIHGRDCMPFSACRSQSIAVCCS
jgi:hypothetical protein